ncbi:MAG: hypothetical protein JWL80_620 [Parcubacteria group bacterium]|nr:hypothetical protein [Parcubacteria group bacterium]
MTSWSRPNVENSGSITISGLSSEEVDGLSVLVKGGLSWVTMKEGRLVFQSTLKPLPAAIDDDEMLPFWRPMSEHRGEVKNVRLDGIDKFDVYSPSFTIQGLCAYEYTPAAYRKVAEDLESWGFQCLRSQRGQDGKYWEIWYLCNLICARGRFEEAISEETGKKQVDKAIKFLCRNTSFGTLDVSAQRAATMMDCD